jgi:hypothetical protein
MATKTITFDATEDTALESYTADGAAFSYLSGSGGDLTVDAANDRVQATGFTGLDFRARYTGTGTTTGDQDVTLTFRVKNSNYAGPLVRCHASQDTCYMVRVNTGLTNEVGLYKVVNGVVGTAIASWDEGVVANDTVTVRLRVVTNGAQNDFQVQTNGGPVRTASDASSPLTSGYPGIYANTDEQWVWLDTLIIDDLATSAEYTLTTDSGSYALTGQQALLLAGGGLNAEAGSYTLLGSEALRDIEMDAVQGEYDLNGQDVSLQGALILEAESGTYTLIGQAAALIYSLVASIATPKGQRRFYGFRLNR